MKANQAFKANDEAVSPVIGVILMVAITVVLAAVVFVLVSNLSKNSNQSAPNLSFNQDKSAQTLTIISADQADWKSLSTKVTAATGAANSCTLKLTHAGTQGADVLGANSGGVKTATAIAASATPISAGDVLTLGGCNAGVSFSLQLTYVPANQLLGTWTFTF